VARRGCEDAEEDVRSGILREDGFYVDLFLKKYSIEPSQSYFDKYADLFTEGFKVIPNIMENYC
jgi:hypothetical protein